MNRKYQLVQNFMIYNFDTITDDSKIETGIEKLLHSTTRKSGYKTESLMVVDKNNSMLLVGIVTIFDILYHLRPSFLHKSFHGDFSASEINWDNQIPHLMNSLKEKTISEIMTRNIISAKPEEHIMSVVDSMIKNKYRRLPVISESKLVGIIYFSDIYRRIFESF